ncbi:hypothetical protein Glove_119g17 [Diversispora epigaea]|uniref:Uncharacterized protein n=2 Tax=Diversispora epigaea TaxID=1348612 RepID=A0A397J9U9_9GLOM|nr:hypothetical protein Glove_119g17 [Diversispora epigaea]
MSTDLQTKIYNFLVNAEEDHITAGSVIYQAIENDTWLEKNELRGIIEQAVSFANNQNVRGSSRHTTLLEILLEFKYPISPLTIPAIQIQNPNAKIPNAEIPNPKSQITISIFYRNPKSQIPNTSNLCILASQIPNYLGFGQHVYHSQEKSSAVWSINKVSISELTWEDPLASQVISDDSDLVLNLPIQLRDSFMFEISYKTVRSLHIIGAVKTNEERPLSSGQIEKNIKALKGKLKKNPAQLHQYLFSSINKVSISELTWEDPLASQVISDDSDLVLNLPIQLRDSFMVKTSTADGTPFLPPVIQEKCNEFVENFIGRGIDSLSRKLVHNGKWKELNEELAEVASRILGTLNDIWNNQAFDPEFAKLQSEGTYVNNVILPAIRATLKCLPLGKSTFVSSSERQSSASADRKGDGRLGRRPDIMFVMKRGEKNYELLYAEYSRLTCTTRKEKNDGVKL